MGAWLYVFQKVSIESRPDVKPFQVAVVANHYDQAVDEMEGFQSLPVTFTVTFTGVSSVVRIRLQNEHMPVGVLAWNGPL